MTVEGRAGRKPENAPKPAVRLQTLTSYFGCIKDNKSSANSEFPFIFRVSLHNHESQVRSRAGHTGELPYLQVVRTFSGSPSSGGWLSWYPEAKGFNNWMHASSEASYNGTPLPSRSTLRFSPPLPSLPLYITIHIVTEACWREGGFPRPVTHKPVVGTQVVAPSDVGGDAHAAGFVFTLLLNGGSKISIIHIQMDS